VATHSDREKKLPLDVVQDKKAFLAHLGQYLHNNRDLLGQKGYHLGAWHDPTDHMIYLDVSHVVKSRGEADQLAKQHGQIAWFDLKAGKSVRVERDDKA
jgi:hypothetical protein